MYVQLIISCSMITDNASRVRRVRRTHETVCTGRWPVQRQRSCSGTIRFPRRWLLGQVVSLRRRRRISLDGFRRGNSRREQRTPRYPPGSQGCAIEIQGWIRRPRSVCTQPRYHLLPEGTTHPNICRSQRCNTSCTHWSVTRRTRQSRQSHRSFRSQGILCSRPRCSRRRPRNSEATIRRHYSGREAPRHHSWRLGCKLTYFLARGTKANDNRWSSTTTH